MNDFTPLPRFLQQMHSLKFSAARDFAEALDQLELHILDIIAREVTQFDNELEDIEHEIQALADGRLAELFDEYEEATLNVQVDMSTKAFWAGFRLGAIQERWITTPDKAFPEISSKLLFNILQQNTPSHIETPEAYRVSPYNYSCQVCGRPINAAEADDNGGMCQSCAAE